MFTTQIKYILFIILAILTKFGDKMLIKNPGILEKLNRQNLEVGGLGISFHRTCRVPAGKMNSLPASLGHFPIFKVEDFKNGVPKDWNEDGMGWFVGGDFGYRINKAFSVIVGADAGIDRLEISGKASPRVYDKDGKVIGRNPAR